MFMPHVNWTTQPSLLVASKLFKSFSIVFLLPDWLKLNHVKSRMECGLSDNFSSHICSIAAETMGVTNYAASFGAKKLSENHI